jgi:hypothetical protein
MNMTGLVTPNYGQMGTEMLPSGNRGARPYGQAFPTSSAPTDAGASMQSHVDSAMSGTGYRPESGRADRLSANIVGGFSLGDGINHR